MRKFQIKSVVYSFSILFLFNPFLLKGATRTATQSGNWSQKATWGNASMPTSTDDVYINPGITVTVNQNASCQSLTMYCGTANASSLSLSGSYTLTLSGNITITNKSAGSSYPTISCPVNLGTNNRTITVDDGASAIDLSITGVISGSVGITKAGSGTLNLSGSNSYTGSTLVNAGILQLGASGGTTNTPLGTTDSGTTISSGAALDLNGYTLGTSEALTLNGTGISNGGALTNSSSTASTYSGLITLGSATSIVASAGNIVLSNTGTISGSGYALEIGGSASGCSIASIIGTGTGTLTKSGSGTWTLSGANTYTGTTYINNGILQLNPTTNANINSPFILNGGTLSTIGIASGRTITNSSTLSVSAASNITLDSSNSHSIVFADSHSNNWNNTLTIRNWQTNAGESGTLGKIYIGSTSSGLTSSQLSNVSFSGFTDGTTILSTGELVPAAVAKVEVWTGGTFQASYSSLKSAFDKINSGFHTGAITLKIIASTSETASAVLNASGTGSANYSSVLLYPSASGLSISGSLAAPLISLNGADNVSIDGRVNGTGSTPDLTITNTNTSSTAGTSGICFQNSASSNVVRYCNITGATTDTSGGVIFFSTSSSGSGNNNNIVEYNNITNVSDANRPINALYSAGSASYLNTGLIIRYNKFLNFLNKANSSNGINLFSNTTACEITGNSFYETTNLAPTGAGDYTAIRIASATNGTKFKIRNNYIGGNAPMANGTWVKTAANNNNFYGIYVGAGGSLDADSTSIYGNVIKNFDYSNSSNANWTAIHVNSGFVNVGTISGNQIGAPTGNDSIKLTNSASADATPSLGIFFGIRILSNNKVKCYNNILGAVTTTNNNTTYSTNLFAIYKDNNAGNIEIKNNLIGSNSTANSLNAACTSTSNFQWVYGIYSAGTASSLISGNTINNLTNSCTNGANTNSTSLAGSYIRGILTENGNNTITNNKVCNLTSNSIQGSNFNCAGIIGISYINGSSSKLTQKITYNTIYNLNNTSTAAAVNNGAPEIYGIFYRGYGNGEINSYSDTIAYNYIRDFNIATTDNSAYLEGLCTYSGNTIVWNNIVHLGRNVTTGCNIFGLWNYQSASGQLCANTIYHNTVFIDGKITGDTSSPTYAIRDRINGSFAQTHEIFNNIFWNTRTGGSKTNYAVFIFDTSVLNKLSINYNDYASSENNFGLIGSTPVSSLATWQSTTAQDKNSLLKYPRFKNETLTEPEHYKPKSLLRGTGKGITHDFGGFPRSVTRPQMGAWEAYGYWKGVIDTDWAKAGNWTSSTIMDEGDDLVFDDDAQNSCVLDTNHTVYDIYNTTNYNVDVNGKTLTIDGNFTLGKNARVNATTTNSTVKFSDYTGFETASAIPDSSFINNNIYNMIIDKATKNVVLNDTINLLNSLRVNSGGKLNAISGKNPTFVYSGSASQTIENQQFYNDSIYNLIIQNVNGVTANTALLGIKHSFTIQPSTQFVIPASKGVAVDGTVYNNAGVSGLLVKASSGAPNGTFIFRNQSNPAVNATVEFYTKSSWDLTQAAGSKYRWQFFGVPVSSVTATPLFTGAYVRKYIESGTDIYNHWSMLSNDSPVEATFGYEICQQSATTYSIQGTLVNNDISKTLDYTDGALYQGQNLYANPYTAGIDVGKINFGTNTEATVYIYNTGTFNEWLSNNGQTVRDSLTTTPGQYTAIPKNLAGVAGIQKEIPSMQGFLVKGSSAVASISIPYNSVTTKNTQPLRITSNLSTPSSTDYYTVINVYGKQFSDKMWLFVNASCTNDFDNGWDGYKYQGTSRAPQIFAMEGNDYLQVNAKDSLNNSYIGFLAGEDSQYTMNFEHNNMNLLYDKIYLTDLDENKTVDISTSGSEYSFTASNNTYEEKRFLITTSLKTGNGTDVSTGLVSINYNNNQIKLTNNTSDKAEAYLYDMSGKCIDRKQLYSGQNVLFENNIPRNIYLAKIEFNDHKKDITKLLIIK